MNRFKNLFTNKHAKVISVYCTAGYPHLESTMPVIKALQTNGADFIEIGMPYSDPLADGPVIQASNMVALHNGITLKILLEQLQQLRQNIGDAMPVILMGYMNPVLQYGFEKFCADAAAVGVDGLILPDLPQYEFKTMYSSIIKKYGLDFIFLVTPETSEERIRELDVLSSGFLYAVSSSSTTGNDKDFSAVEAYLQRLQSMQLKNSIIVGFGIKNKETFERACKYANGVAIGTAYIKALQTSDDVETATKQFLQSVLQ